MRPELELLRAILPALAGRPAGNLPPPGSISWPFFLRLTKVHRLSPLFFHLLGGNAASPPQPRCRPGLCPGEPSRRLTEAAYSAAAGHDLPGYFPLWVRSAWEAEFNAALWKAVLVQDGLGKALEALRRRGLKTMVLKGARLAASLYPHPALRPADDSDLLVRREEAGEVRPALAAAGWEFVSETPTALKFSRPGAGRFRAFLEVHTDLQAPSRRNPAFSIRISDFWETSRADSVAGVPVRALSAETEAFYLAAHAGHHGFSRLIWLYDLDRIAARGELSWEGAALLAVAARSATPVWLALLRTREFFGSAIPAAALEMLAPARHRRIVLEGLFPARRFLEGEAERERGLTLLDRFALNDRWGEALRSFLLHFPARPG